MIMFRRTVLTAAAVASVITGCATPTPRGAVPATMSAAGAHVSAAPSAPSKSPTTTSSPSTPLPAPAQIRAQARLRIAKIIAAEPRGGVSVAVLDTQTHRGFSAGAQSGMWTASVYKLLVLTALLLRQGSLDDDEIAAATRAIENSDNLAGYSLFLEAGGNSGLDAALDTLGMTHTVPGTSDPTLTTTSAGDYLKLLEALVTKGPLSASARSLLLNLMRDVKADQRWGVGVVADKGTTFANKNGWLSIDDSNVPGETDDGLWAVTSVGVLTVNHHRVLMSIFTRHQASFGSGVALVQTLAKSLARTIVPDG
jgi:beta-lactamase class A